MAQYIDKSVVIAEIENKINKIDLNSIEDWRYRLQREHDIEVMKNIISIINTLEVKDMNLEKEIDLVEDKYRGFYSLSRADVIDIVKHFFELGLKASNSITEVNLESLVRQVIGLYLEAGKHYNSVIEEERKEYGGSDLAIKLFDGVIDAKELSIQYVLDKLKAQKGE